MMDKKYVLIVFLLAQLSTVCQPIFGTLVSMGNKDEPQALLEAGPKSCEHSLPLVHETHTEETIVISNGILEVAVEGSLGVGTYTIRTGPHHSSPDQDVFFGGAAMSPWSTYNTIHVVDTKREYVTTSANKTPDSGYTCVQLDLMDPIVTFNSTAVTVSWETLESLLVTQEIQLTGTTEADTNVRVTEKVTNTDVNVHVVGIRYLWDLMIDGEDGSYLKPWMDSTTPGSWLDIETEWTPPGFQFWEATNDPAAPIFSIYGYLISPTAVPQPTAPDRFVLGSWFTAYHFAHDYTPTGQAVGGSGTDSAVLYYWSPISLSPYASRTVTAYVSVRTKPSPDEIMIEDIICPETLTHDLIAFKLHEPLLPGDAITPGPFEIVEPWSLQWSSTHGGYGHSQFAQPVGDIDEDGVNEIIVGGYETLGRGRAQIISYDEGMATYREEHSWTYAGGDYNAPSGACVVDLNGNGDLEFVMSWAYSGSDGVYAYDWDGSSLATLDVYRGVGLDFAFDVYACDYDDDGDVEVLIANAPGRVGGYHVTALGWDRVYGRFTEETSWRLSGHEDTMECPMVWSGDTDADGNTEVIAVISDSYSGTAGTWALNWDPAEARWTEERVYAGLVGGGTHYGVTVGDIDGNGIPEIGVGNNVEGVYGAAAVLLEWNAGTKAYEKVWEGSWPAEECVIEAVAIGDVNNDGANEFCVGGGNVHIISWGVTGYAEERIIDETTGLLSGVNIGDCDSDGLNELKACDILDLGPGSEWIFKHQADANGFKKYHIGDATWFYWIDDCPYAMFTHDTRYVFIDNATGEYVVEEENWWPHLNEEELWSSPEEYWNKDNWVYSTYKGDTPTTPTVMDNAIFLRLESSTASTDNPSSHPKKRSLIIEGVANKSHFARLAAENWRRQLIENFGYSDDEIIFLSPKNNRDYINGTSKVANVNQTIYGLSKELNRSDSLWVFIVAHGGATHCDGFVLLPRIKVGERKFICDKFTDTQLAQQLSQVNASITVVIDSCYSGSFIEDLGKLPQVNIIVTSTDWKSQTYHASDGLDPPETDWEKLQNMGDPNTEDEGGEFSSGFIEGLGNNSSEFVTEQMGLGELYCRAFAFAKENDAGYIYRENLIARENKSEMGPFPLIKNKNFIGDLNGDGLVDIFDVVIVAQAFGSKPGSRKWNPVADIDSNAIVDIFDVVTTVNNFSKKYFG